MNYSEFTFDFGAEKPFSALHIADTHLLFSDGRDDIRKFRNSQKRTYEFEFTNVGRNVPYLLDALCYAKKHNCIVIHSGDLYDFTSRQNLECMQSLLELSGVEFLYVPGNHDFGNYPGIRVEYPEEIAANRLVAKQYIPEDFDFNSKVINGIDFVCVNNGDTQFSREVLLKVEAEIRRGLPIVLNIHIPIYTDELADFDVKQSGGRTISLSACPFEAGKRYPGSSINFATSESRAFLELLRDSPNVRLVLAGHTHYHDNVLFPLWGDCRQLIAGGGYYGCGSVLNFR